MHFMPLSHLDAGWINTMDYEYDKHYRDIINSITDTLYTNEHYTFNFADIIFLDMWWKESSELSREKFRKIVKRD